MSYCHYTKLFRFRGILLGIAILSGGFAVTPAAAQQYTAAGNTRLFDVSGDGRLVLQRDGFAASGEAINNMSVLDVVTGAVEPVNYDGSGNLIRTTTGTMSADGRFVAFQSGTKTLYLRDRVEGTSIIISKTVDGGEPNGDTAYPRVSPDGRFVAFLSRATNLVAETLPATSAFTANLFIYDRIAGTVAVGARTHDGGVLNAAGTVNIGLPMNRFSADSRYMLFLTAATNAHQDMPSTFPFYTLLYRRDLISGEVLLLSRNAAGEVVLGNYSYPAISNDGNKVAFLASSLASDLASGSRGGVYVKDVASGAIVYASETTDGSSASVSAGAGNFSMPLSLSGDGRHVAFNSPTSKLLAQKDGSSWGIFVSTIADDGSVSMKLISLPEGMTTHTSANEGTDPIFAREQFVVAFQSDDRTLFLPELGRKEGPILYRNSHSDSNAGSFDAGSLDYGSGFIGSPLLGILYFYPNSGWAFSYTLQTHLYFDLTGPTFGDANGVWFYMQDVELSVPGNQGSWVFSGASAWNSSGPHGGWIYVVTGLAGAPDWFSFPR